MGAAVGVVKDELNRPIGQGEADDPVNSRIRELLRLAVENDGNSMTAPLAKELITLLRESRHPFYENKNLMKVVRACAMEVRGHSSAALALA